MTKPKTRSERETVLTRAMDEKHWHAFSEDSAVVRKLERLHGPGTPRGDGFCWLIPKNCVTFRNPASRVGSHSLGNLRNLRSNRGSSAQSAELDPE
jgi:hypothetical protein